MSTFGQITLAFLSSRIQETESKLFSAARARLEFGGLTDVGTRGVVSLITYPITTHADCKSMNLIYQLQCTESNAFYIGETRRFLSDSMNGHRFTITVSNPDLPVAIHTQSHQIIIQDCWSNHVIHKLPELTHNHIHCQFETAYQLNNYHLYTNFQY